MLDVLNGLSAGFSWIDYLVEIGLLILAAWLLQRIVKRWPRQRERRKPVTVEDRILVVLDAALVPMLVLGLLAAALNLFPLREKLLTVLNRFIYAAFLILLLYYGAQAFQILLNQWLDRGETNPAMREPVRYLGRAVFLVLGIMLVLENLGVSLTAIWTTVGVGSVAVALALQDTLSNFFGGIYLQLDQPVRLGDYVKLGSGEEGFVIQMGWRSTRMVTLSNNVVVIPNSKLATQVVTNYSLPEPGTSISIHVRVGYDADPEVIERILLEETTRGGIEGLRPDPPSAQLIPGFGDAGLDFSLSCNVARYQDQYRVQHELRKRIFARFRREGIRMPYPQRDVHLDRAPAAPEETPEAPHNPPLASE